MMEALYIYIYIYIYISDNNIGTSAIDLTLTSATIGANAQWETMDTINSDHFPILTTYKRRNIYSKIKMF